MEIDTLVIVTFKWKVFQTTFTYHSFLLVLVFLFVVRPKFVIRFAYTISFHFTSQLFCSIWCFFLLFIICFISFFILPAICLINSFLLLQWLFFSPFVSSRFSLALRTRLVFSFPFNYFIYLFRLLEEF